MFDSSKIWTLNKESLLQRVSQAELLNYYLPGKGSKYKLLCPFHKDTNPSLNINLYKGTFNCYSCGAVGDIFAYIMRRYNVDFIESLKIIANDFNLLKVDYERKPSLELFGIAIRDKPTEIKIKIRKWTNKDVLYWKQFNISIGLCEKYNIYPISHYWINNRIFEAKKQLIYAYNIGLGFKIYKPFAVEYKWFSSLKRDDIFGLLQLDYSRKDLVITKSLKDVACLESFGVSAIAPQAESILISKELMDFLKIKFKNIYTLFDYDNSGIHLSWQMRRLYNTIPLIFAEKTWGRKKGYKGCKDISEFTNTYIEEVPTLIRNTFKLL